MATAMAMTTTNTKKITTIRMTTETKIARMAKTMTTMVMVKRTMMEKKMTTMTRRMTMMRMLAKPPLRCPLCGRLTRMRYECQWCNKKDKMGRSRAENQAKRTVSSLHTVQFQTQNLLRQRGYCNVRVS